MRDLDQLTTALRQFLPDGEGIVAIRALTTGFSNETYMIDGLDLILRLPPSAGAMLAGHDVIGQARIYQELATTTNAPTVPRVVAICPDAAIIGVPFFVMERVAGASIDDITMAPWFLDGTDAIRNRVCREWVGAFASLSTLTPLATLGAVVSPADDMRVWRDFAGAANCPTLVGLFDRLLQIPAPISGPPALVHGDPKLANLMWHDGQISAMLDWEMALNGEPLANLGYLLFQFDSEYHVGTRAPRQPGMLSRDEVIALWSQVSGRSAQGVFWHEIAQVGKIAAIIAEGVNMANTGRSNEPRLEIFKQNIGYFLGVMATMLDAGEARIPEGRP